MSQAAKLDLEDEILTMGIWDATEVEVKDEGLRRYINLENVLEPRSKGRHQDKQFYKSDVAITERVLNRMYTAGHRGDKHLITSGHNVGNSERLWNTLEETFHIIEDERNQNPIQVLVDAICNSGPREEVVTYQRGGTRARKAVIVSPQRRVDLALRLLVQGAYEKRLEEDDSAAQVLADELMLAADEDDDARAVREAQRKEREAEGAR